MNDTNSDFAVKRQLLQMQMLYEIGLAINESLDPIQVVDEILNRAMVMIDARVGLLIVKEDGESIIIGQVGTENDLTAILQLPEVAQAWSDSQLRQHQIDTPAGRLYALFRSKVGARQEGSWYSSIRNTVAIRWTFRRAGQIPAPFFRLPGGCLAAQRAFVRKS